MKKLPLILTFFIFAGCATTKNEVGNKNECPNGTEYLAGNGKVVKLGCRPVSQIAKVIKVENTRKATVGWLSLNSGKTGTREVMQCDILLEAENKILKYRNVFDEWLCEELRAGQLVEISIENEKVVSITSLPDDNLP